MRRGAQSPARARGSLVGGSGGRQVRTTRGGGEGRAAAAASSSRARARLLLPTAPHETRVQLREADRVERQSGVGQAGGGVTL